MSHFILYNAPKTASTPSGHTWWRINIETTRFFDGIFASIQEIEFRAELDGPSVTTGGTAFADTAVSPGLDNYSAYAAFDGVTTGDTESFWTMPSTSPQPCSIGYEFASPVDIVQVSLFSGASSTRAARMPRNFTLDWSDDGVSWTTAMTVVDAPAFGVYQEQVFTV